MAPDPTICHPTLPVVGQSPHVGAVLRNDGRQSNALEEQEETGVTRRLKLHVLATGSKGNCSVIEDAETGHSLVIDCGICKRDFVARCVEAGVDTSRIDAVLVTHAHSDHTSGLGVALRGLANSGCTPTVFAHQSTVLESKPLQKIAAEGHRVRALEPGGLIEMGRLTALPFPTSHDTLVSFGFRIEAGSDAVGFMTDTGIATNEALQALEGCRVLALEANHDVQMLKDGPYPFWLKQRILGNGGHLSNNQCAELLTELNWGKLEHVVAMHASEKNNTYDLALDAVAATLRSLNDNAKPHVGYQHKRVSIG